MDEIKTECQFGEFVLCSYKNLHQANIVVSQYLNTYRTFTSNTDWNMTHNLHFKKWGTCPPCPPRDRLSCVRRLTPFRLHVEVACGAVSVDKLLLTCWRTTVTADCYQNLSPILHRRPAADTMMPRWKVIIESCCSCCWFSRVHQHHISTRSYRVGTVHCEA